MENMPELNGITGTSSEESFSISNNYRFDALIRAIDFFSQKFNIETLIDFSIDFIYETLTLGSSVSFIYDKKEDCFNATRIRLYDDTPYKLQNSSSLQNLATLYGTVISKDFNRFFSSDFINKYKPKLLIPLILDNKLIGFILTSGKAVGDITEDDIRMSKAIMHLFNDAFERNHYIELINHSMEKPDKGILEAFNKITSTFFSERNLDNLFVTGVEIFSEISGSMNTSFGLLSKNKNAIKLKAYADVAAYKPCPDDCYFELLENCTYDASRVIYDIDNDIDLLKKIFKTPEKFLDFEAKYVILLAKGGILGFVTLGKDTRGQKNYTNEILDLIVSIAILCFIAVQNAMLFDVLDQYKDEDEKCRKLSKLFC